MKNVRVPQNLKLWNVGGGLTVLNAPGPGGGTQDFAFSVTEPASGVGEFYLDWFFTTPAGQIYPRIGAFTITALFKANGRQWAWLDAGNGVVDRYAYFDIENGVQGATSGPDVTSTITDVGDGWFLCTMHAISESYSEGGSPPFADNAACSIGPADANDGFGYEANGTGILVARVTFDAPGLELQPAANP